MKGRCRVSASAPEHPRMSRRTPHVVSSLDWATRPRIARLRSVDRTGLLARWVSPAVRPLCDTRAPTHCSQAGRPDEGVLKFVLFVLSIFNVIFLLNVLSMYSTLVLGMLISPFAIVIPFRFFFFFQCLSVLKCTFAGERTGSFFLFLQLLHKPPLGVSIPHLR